MSKMKIEPPITYIPLSIREGKMDIVTTTTNTNAASCQTTKKIKKIVDAAINQNPLVYKPLADI